MATENTPGAPRRPGYVKHERTPEEAKHDRDQALKALEARYGDRTIDVLEAAAIQQEITYDDYIEIGTLLSLQHTLTDFHDELVFKMYHQQTELWFRLVLHEMERAIRSLVKEEVDLINALDAATRINRYFGILTGSFSVLLDGLSTDEFMIF